MYSPINTYTSILRNDSANSTDHTLHGKDCIAPETPHHVLPEQVFGSFGLSSIGSVRGILQFCITYYLNKCLESLMRMGLYSIDSVSGTICSSYECLLGIKFLNNGF